MNWKHLKRFESFFPDVEWREEDEYELSPNDIEYWVENQFNGLTLTGKEIQVIMNMLDKDKITQQAKNSNDPQIIYINVSEEVIKQITEKDLLTVAGVYKRLDQERFVL